MILQKKQDCLRTNLPTRGQRTLTPKQPQQNLIEKQKQNKTRYKWTEWIAFIKKQQQKTKNKWKKIQKTKKMTPTELIKR